MKMKIGVVHFGSFSVGATEIIRSLIEGSPIYGYSLYGIEFDRTVNQTSVKTLDQQQEVFLKSYPEKNWDERNVSVLEDQFDSIIVLGGRDQQNRFQTLKTLHIPLSIYNDVDGSQYTVGYDTAINSIITNIEKIRDTASSLSYHKLRVFHIQLPGKKPTPLLWNTALAVGAEVVTSTEEKGIIRIKQAIRLEQDRGESYFFLLMDRSVEPSRIEELLADQTNIDCKVVVIDESQCVGPYPTAQDRILTKKIIQKVFNWIETSGKSGRLVIRDDQVIFFY